MSESGPDRPRPAPGKSRDPLLYAAPALILAALLVLGLIAWLASPEDSPSGDNPAPAETGPGDAGTGKSP
ncbi:hypothetical protein [Pseudomarimonas salicorniae]|uniref:Uncharacterized protein n=1 Tax=Pseudomarimonas salicorniae TaxID=2933270 RepID=A0ABT0GCA9_9GAMM|nr:hypothetical protein [Lysobacter sp. CAU 1642]MCK7592171.1 hypothetical protein [Lysobacter sp. CAU 1642]